MKDKHGIGQAIVMITQLGINMLVPVFMILGIMASIRSMFITLKPLLKGEREKKDEAFKKQLDEQFKDSE